MAWYGVITDAGKTAIENHLASGVGLNLNVVKTGTGTVERSQMTSVTDMVAYAGDGSIIGKTGSPEGAKVEISIESASTRYVMKEIGIFATLQDDSTVLIAYYNDDDIGVEIPTVEDFPDFNFTLFCLLDIINSEDLTITIDPSAYVTMGKVKNDLTTPSTDEGYVLDARQGKVLNDKIAQTYPSNAGTTDQILRKSSGGGAYWSDPATATEIGEAVTDWLEDNLPQGETLVVDPTLAIEQAAADAKVVGDKIAELKDDVDFVMVSKKEIDITGYSSTKCCVTDHQTLIQQGNNYWSYQFAPEELWKYIEITANNNYGAYITFLTEAVSADPSTGTSIESILCTGETGRHVISHAKTETFKIPSDCGNIIIAYVNNSLNVLPSSVVVCTEIAGIVNKLMDEINDIGSEVSLLTEGEPVNIPYDEITGYSINASTGGLITSSVYNCTDYVDIRGFYKIDCKRVTITSANSNYTGIAFYDKNKNYLYGINCKWNADASGYEDGSYIFPKEVAYMRCSIRKDTETHGEYSIIGYKRTENNVDVFIEPYFNMENAGSVNVYTGADVSSDVYCKSNYIYCNGFDYIRFRQYISTIDATVRGLSFYDENKNALTIGAGMFQGETAGFVDRIMSIPQNAYYFRYTYVRQEKIIEVGLPDPFIHMYKANTVSQRIGRSDGQEPTLGSLFFRKPRSKGIENAIRRMHQLSNLKWTPVHNFPKEMHNISGGVTYSEYIAGIEYTGLPYSVTYDRRKNINVECSIDVFMSAVANDKTRMYATNTQNYPRYSYFGAVCSSFVSGAMGLKCAPLTKDMPDFEWFDKVSPYGAYNLQTLELGDILLKASSHTAAVSGILCDNTGKVVLVEVSQESLHGYIATGKANSRWYTKEQFFDRFGDFDLYRYRYIDEVEYFESDYSQVFPEGMSYGQAKHYICPVFGDRCMHRTSSSPFEIGVASNAYSDGGRTIKVFRNGVLEQTETIDDETEIVSVSRGNVGEYLLALVDESGDVLDTVEYSIVDGAFTKSVSGGVAVITYHTESILYAIEYTVSGDNDQKFIPIKPVTGNGSVEVHIPENSSIVGVVIGDRRSSMHISV